MSEQKKWLAVATIRKPHGVKGLIKLMSYSGDYQHLSSVDEVRVSHNAKIQVLSIEKKIFQGSQLLLKLEGIDTPEAVKQLSGAELMMLREELDPCEEGEFFIADLVGCSLFYQLENCGEVVSVITNAPHELLEIKGSDGKKFLVPMVKNFVGEIDIENHKIELLERWFVE